MFDYKRRIDELPKGSQILHEPLLNKGSAFSLKERDALNLNGLLPPIVLTIEEQKKRIMKNFNNKHNDLEKYIFLIALQDRNETLFYKTVTDEIETLMPIIYTPVVGEACQKYGHIFRRPRGLYISKNDQGNIINILKNWPNKKVDVIVVTDGERILGLGDLGSNGMGIPVGKLSLYTACAGIDPARCLPIMLDVGTENENLKSDPLYIGLTDGRIRGDDYDSFIDEFMEQASLAFPDAIIQFEDFGNRNASRLLEKYKNNYRMFNDDIQGTAAVALAGLLSSQGITKKKLAEEKILFYGAGTAGIGIANLYTSALVEKGYSEDAARKRCWFIDSKGLVTKGRKNLSKDKIPFAHDHDVKENLCEIIESIRPTALIGISGQGHAFSRDVLELMAEINDRPIVFALSNPTSVSECTAQQAYKWTKGRCLFASGSPFGPVELEGKTFVPGQGNNAYIFPGVGLGIVLSRSKIISDDLFLSAAHTLSSLVSDEELSNGQLYPSLSDIRSVSKTIAISIAKKVIASGLTNIAFPKNLEKYLDSIIYNPEYRDYI
jgi:malate dehydrogenase (oxaloacetate-decarboxylating)(NADP+)